MSLFICIKLFEINKLTFTDKLHVNIKMLHILYVNVSPILNVCIRK